MGETNFKSFLKYLHKEQTRGLNLSKMEMLASRANKTDLKWFFRQWFEYLSIPELKLDYQIRKLLGAKYGVTLTIIQYGKDIYSFPLNIKIVTEEGNILRRFFINKRKYKFSLSFFTKPVRVIFDEENFILKEIVQ